MVKETSMEETNSTGTLFTAGDRVRGLAIESRRPMIGVIIELYCTRFSSSGTWVQLTEGTAVLDRSTLRHEPAEQKAFYGTQPDVLPKTLPDGTLGLDGWAHYGVALDHGTYLFRSAKCVADGRQIQNGGIRPDGLDWSKILVQDSPPARASADLRDTVKVGEWVEWTDESFGLMRGERIFRRDHFTVRYSGVERTSIVNHECGWHYGNPLPASMRKVEPPKAEPVRGDPPAKQPRRDPNVCHRETMARNLSGSPYAKDGVLERSIAFQMAKKNETRLSAMTLRERRKSEALRMLDRPLPVRTGALLDRDKYGQRVALHGWSEDAEYEGQV